MSFNFFSENSNQFRIFCDMDGVLTDFDYQFRSISGGIAFDEWAEKNGKNSAWEIIKSAAEEFWSEMPWTEDGKTLWIWLQSHSPTILSAPSIELTSKTGKTKWVNTHLGISQNPTTNSDGWDINTRLIFDKDKHLYVLPNTVSILIDDTPKKIDAWRAAGGIGLLHSNATETINTLTEILNSL